MKWKFAAAFLFVAVVDMYVAPPADACGVKLTVKSSAPRKAVARTSNPSDVLLLGDPPRRLERDLSAAGHRVDVAPNAAAAKKKTYAVVVTDQSHESEARSNFKESLIIVRSGDVAADMHSVEGGVARKPVGTSETRVAIGARPAREVIAAGPAQPKPEVVSAKTVEPTPEPEKPAVAPTPPPAKPETKAPPVQETRTAEVKPPPEVAPPPTPEKPKAVAKAGSVHDEVYFSVGSAKVSTATLNRAVRWLKEASDVAVVVEGHADPTGSHDGNLALGQKRAEIVRDFLVSAGIDDSRIEVISYGDTKLRYGRTDRRNRRAAIVVK